MSTEPETKRPKNANGGGPLTIGYWHIRGLGAPLRMMCRFAGVPYEDVTYPVTGSKAAVAKGRAQWDTASWFGGAKQALREKNALINLPYVIDGETVITQSNACLSHLGRRFGLMGSTPAETAAAEQCLAQVMDLRNDAVGCFYGYGSNFEREREQAGTHYKKLAAWLEQRGTRFLAGGGVTAPDFHLWEMLDQHEALMRDTKRESLLGEHPRLRAYYDEFLKGAPAGLREYLESGEHVKYPPNNRMAKWGAEVESKAQDICSNVSFNTVAREWRLKWSLGSGADKKSLEEVQVILESILPEIWKIDYLKSVHRVVCGGCLDYKVVLALPADHFGAWEGRGFLPEKQFLDAVKSVSGVSGVETQTYTLAAVIAEEDNNAEAEGKAQSICSNVSFDTVAREWRLKWSLDEGGGKKSLEEVQALLESILPEIRGIDHLKSVQRVVCGGCLDYKVVLALPADQFGAWEGRGFSPEKQFLDGVKSVSGVSGVETQTYTLSRVL